MAYHQEIIAEVVLDWHQAGYGAILTIVVDGGCGVSA